MIALCFLTYDNLSQTELRNRELQKTALYNIYIDNKKPFCDHVTHFHDYCIDDIVPTKWGHISLIHPTLNLFKEAYENGVEINVLQLKWTMNGECYFIRNDLPINL